MPIRNRVTPFGDIVADAGRGTLMGNRGVLHDAEQRIVRDSQVRRWIACRLEFRGRWRPIMQPGRWTELFFLDEAAALAAGHRPCAECRHADFVRFKHAWQRVNPSPSNSPSPPSSHSPSRSPSPAQSPSPPMSRSASRSPLLSPSPPMSPSASAALTHAVDAIDRQLHAERRLGPWRKRVYVADLAALPDGAYVALGNEAWLVLGDALLAWSAGAYHTRRPRPRHAEVSVLTPASLVAVIRAG